MILFPAIHIKDGVVARLTRAGSDLQHAEVLHESPGERAAEFEAQKFPWLHVVDLDGAFSGKPINAPAIDAILKNVKIPVQLSGGMRDLESIEYWLDKGVARVVLTTMAIEKPDIAREACRKFPGRVAIKIDSRDGRAVTTGWTKSSTVKALDLALRFEDAGAAAIIHADINNDDALGGINLEAIIDLAFALTTPVIASGGVGSIHDITALKSETRAGVAGLILGRALYTGKINAEEALKIAAG